MCSNDICLAVFSSVIYFINNAMALIGQNRLKLDQEPSPTPSD